MRETDVIVIGGGLAGCGVAVHLARAGRRVTLLEKGRYPQDKLCGEFLSVEVQERLRRLGVAEAVRAAGARPITRTVVTAGRRRFERPLPGVGLGITRRRLDLLLVEAARAAGVDVREGTAARDVQGGLGDGFEVGTSDGVLGARVVVGAYGKRGMLDRKLARPFFDEPVDEVAFKAHYEGAPLPETVELHAFPGGYVGLSEVEDGRINVCWIGRADVLRAGGGTPEGMLDAAAAANPALASRLAPLRRVSERFIAVSQVSLARKTAFSGDVCMIGDAAGMIAPMCGDGMAMALRGAEMAAPRIDAFLDGGGAAAFRRAYTEAWRREFGLRLRIGRVLHAGIMRDRLARAAVAGLGYAPAFGDWLIRRTRGEAEGEA